MSKKLVLAATSWNSLYESLRANSKHGYNSLCSLERKDGYFIAGLSQENDVEYMKLLVGEYGMEDYVKLLGEPLMLVSVVSVVQEAVQAENVALKINRTPRSKK